MLKSMSLILKHFLIPFFPLASKAVDCLLDSKWAKAKKGEEALFTTRESVVDYCNRYDLASFIIFINESSCQDALDI